jgi:hypothetical protein
MDVTSQFDDGLKSGAASFSSSQYAPTVLTAAAKSAKLTGFRT